MMLGKQGRNEMWWTSKRDGSKQK